MKTKNLFVAIAVSIVTVLGFTVCTPGGHESSNTNLSSPALVEYSSTGRMTLGTAFEVFIPDNASAANLLDLYPGSSIFMWFDYNTEYQTDKDYPVASNIYYEPVTVDYIQEDDPEMIADYNFPFSSVQWLLDPSSPRSTSFSLNYKGRFFVLIAAKLGTNQALHYYPYIKVDEPLDENGARNIYLQAKLPGTSTGTQDVFSAYGLNMRSMLYYSGRDTTITEAGVTYSLRYIKINLKYCKSIDNGTPVFQSMETQPIPIYVLKDDL